MTRRSLSSSACLLAACVLSACAASRDAGDRPVWADGPRLASERITIIEFSTEDARVEWQRPTEPLGMVLAEEIAGELRRRGRRAEAVPNGTAPGGDIVVSGRITRILEGNRAARLFVGFGAGAGKVGAEGSVTRADGTPVATFRDERWSSGMGGGFGRGAQEIVEVCVRRVGLDIAEMIDTGRYRH